MNDFLTNNNTPGIDIQQTRFLQFDLGSESYAVELLNVKEVIPVPETAILPNSPNYYVGIMNLRGQIISVIDLRKKLNITPKEKDLEEAVIIFEIDGIGVGAIVDSINKVLNLSTNEIKEVPEIKSQVNTHYIQGVYNQDNQLTIVLDIAKILDIFEIKKLSESAA